MPDNQGAAGVRLQIIDNSTFVVPVTPLTVGAVAGYSTKGPFNTIIPLNSNADVSNILGDSAFQNPKYNQALIAARGILLGGGGAEFVRIFSETADLTNGKGALKSDAWLVRYNKSSSVTNFTTEFFAATNNVAGETVRDLDGNLLSNSHVDGYAEYGNREIYDISTVASTNEVRDFSLDSSFVGNDIPIFSILPTDPSSTIRGNGSNDDRLVVKTAANETYFATASVSIDFSSVATNVSDGNTISIFDTTFEFDDDSTITSGNVAVTIGADLEASVSAFRTAVLAQGGLLSGIERADLTFDGTGDLTILLIQYMGFDYGTVSSSNTDISIISNSGNFLPDSKFRGELVIKHDPAGESNGTEISAIVDISANINQAMTTALTETALSAAADTIATGLSSVPVGTSFRFSQVPTGMTIAGASVLTTTVYYVQNDSAGTIKISSTPGGSALDITAEGTGSLELTGVDQITLGAGESVTEGDPIVLKGAGVATLTGTSDEKLYYVTHIFNNATEATASTFQLSETINGDIVELDPVSATGAVTIYEPTVITVGSSTPSITGDTVTIFGKTFEFTSGTASAGNAKIGTPSGAGNMTSGQFASLIVNAINTNDLPIDDVEVYIDETDSTGTTVILEYRHVGLDNVATKSRVDASSTISGALLDRASADVTATALTNVDDSNLSALDQEIQPIVEYANILVDDVFGIEFESLGLANELSFQNNAGAYVKKYQLNASGETVARSYITVDLTVGGNDRSFSGTIVPLVVNGENLYIVEQTIPYADEFAFIINDNDDLEDSLAEGFIDLGSTKVSGVPTSSFVQYAYDDGASDDPTASTWSSDPTLNTFIWSYDPKRNQDSTGLSAVWELFLDKDTSDVAYFVSAGLNIRNFGKKGRETVDMSVVNAILDVCDKRKDCVAFFDAPDYKNVETVIDRCQGFAGVSTEAGRWGSVWDGRDVMDDVFYTKLTVNNAKTVGLGYTVMSNTRGGSWWLPPAGLENGSINGLFATRQKYQRTFNFAGDKKSDIAKLYNNYINPTRVTSAGQQYHGQKTLVRENSAFQRINVSMLIAGINKRFEKILDRLTFNLNTRELREQIQSTLQAELNSIKTASPAGITTGTVVCDTSNNTDAIIRQRRLIVDIVNLRATEAAEFITLRTTVEQSGEGNDITTQII